MNAKKNLTIAGLAALLAVPAFGAVNGAHVHMPQIFDNLTIDAHADNYVANNNENLTYRGVTGLRVTPVRKNVWTPRTYNYEKVYIPKYSSVHTEYYGGTYDVIQPRNIVGQYKVPADTINPTQRQQRIGVSAMLNAGGKQVGPDFVLNKDGYHIYESAAGFWINNREASLPTVLNLIKSLSSTSNNGNGSNSGITNTGYMSQRSAELGSTSSLISNNDSVNAQNMSSNQKLPQTGEINHKTDELVSSIMLGFAATTLAGASLELKKHRK